MDDTQFSISSFDQVETGTDAIRQSLESARGRGKTGQSGLLAVALVDAPIPTRLWRSEGLVRARRHQDLAVVEGIGNLGRRSTGRRLGLSILCFDASAAANSR